MRIVSRSVIVACMAVLLAAPVARAQVTTGSITGNVTDASGAVLPGVSVSLSGERLIGGAPAADDRRRPGTIASIGCRRAPISSSSSCRDSGRSSMPTSASAPSFVATVTGADGGGRRQRVDHRLRRVTHGRHQVERAADRDEPGDPRRRADRAGSVVAREADSRRAGRDLRRRRDAVDAAERLVVARLQHQRRQLQHRRRDGELAGRRRRRDDAVLRPGHVRGGQLHHGRDSRGSDGGRRLDQHGDQERAATAGAATCAYSFCE